MFVIHLKDGQGAVVCKGTDKSSSEYIQVNKATWYTDADPGTRKLLKKMEEAYIPYSSIILIERDPNMI